MRSLRAVFACCLLGAVTLGATVVPRMSLGEIADSSERVIHGVVTRKWSAWDDSRRYIWTHYEIQIRDTLKGPAGTRFTISEPGGMVGDVGMHLSGAPEFRAGDEIIVFAYQTPIDYWRVRGYSQGGFIVNPGEDGLQLVAPLAPAGLKLVGVPSGESPPFATTGLELGKFKSQVRTLVNLSREER